MAMFNGLPYIGSKEKQMYWAKRLIVGKAN